VVPPPSRKAAMDSGVARKPIEDMDAYRRDGGYGDPVLVGRAEPVLDKGCARWACRRSGQLRESTTAQLAAGPAMVDMLYARLQRRGYLRRDCERMVNQDRNVFGSLLLKLGEADAMITGTTRTFARPCAKCAR
jgi:malate dehydrogenase (oxaloacetate-decarboxylating)(NADP+)